MVNLCRSTWEEYGPFAVFAIYTLAFALQLRKNHGKDPSQGSPKVLVGQYSMCQNGRLFLVARTRYRFRSPCFRGPGSTLGQRKYLPRSVTKRFHTSANVVLYLSVGHVTTALYAISYLTALFGFTLFNKIR